MRETGEATGKRVRRDYSRAEKLRMVEATLESGASVARVAQTNGVNPNLVFVWRKQHREGRLVSHGSAARLLPVAVTDARPHIPEQNFALASRQAGILHIDLPRGRVRIEGNVDSASLHVVLEMLLR